MHLGRRPHRDPRSIAPSGPLQTTHRSAQQSSEARDPHARRGLEGLLTVPLRRREWGHWVLLLAFDGDRTPICRGWTPFAYFGRRTEFLYRSRPTLKGREHLPTHSQGASPPRSLSDRLEQHCSAETGPGPVESSVVVSPLAAVDPLGVLGPGIETVRELVGPGKPSAKLLRTVACPL